MATHKIGKARHDRLDLTGNADRWVIADNGSVNVNSGLALFEGRRASHLDIDINGEVSTNGAKTYAGFSQGVHSDWAIGSQGMVKGWGGLFYEGRGSDLSNAGLIRAGGGAAVWFDDYSHSVGNSGSIISGRGTALGLNSGYGDISNSGLIKGEVGLYAKNSGLDLHNMMDARLLGGHTAIWAEGSGSHTIVNDGTIAGGTWAVLTGRGADRVENNGQMEGFVGLGGGNDRFYQNDGNFSGYVYLGGGNDKFFYKGGTFEDPDGNPSQVNGGKGNDLYVTGAFTAYLVEAANGGIDTLKTTVSTTLAANIENMVLGGHEDISAFGNGLANRLTGNSGANFIYGNNGADILDGKAGADFLNGGAGKDIFIFSSGYGNDTISQWGDGKDRVDLSKLAGITSYNDLINNHAVQNGADVVITDGADTLTFTDIALANLTADDFIF